MSKIEINHPDKLASTGAYSAAVLSDGWPFTNGHAAGDLTTGELLDGSTGGQARTTLESIGSVLNAAGAGVADVVKSTCRLADIRDLQKFNAVDADFFRPPPARTAVQSVLPEHIRVEMDVIARMASREGGYE